ncbi:MAG: hypothetical protein M1840_006348 [Geoglossum simile]|nr:MAG: hypothetical protein M1840_006348 [Geoglossum simile]
MKSTTKPPEVSLLDHRIGLRNGSTIALEATAKRLQSAKISPPADMRARVEELSRENGHLRREVQFYRDCFDLAQHFRHTVSNISQQLQVAYYMDAVNNEDAIEFSNGLATDLRHALEHLADDQLGIEKSWLEFWEVEDTEDEYKNGI